MASDGTSAEDLPAWLTPREALALLSAAFDVAVAADAILQSLRGGLLRSIAASSSWEFDGKTQKPTSEVLIPADRWGALSHTKADIDLLWDAGVVRFWLHPKASGYPKPRVVRYFGIKFERVGVEALLPPPRAKTAIPTKPPGEAQQDEEADAPRGPPVSKAALAAWYKAYQTTYRGSEDTLANAYKSARGMFPGKFVSRDSVRELCKGRKIGRKPRDEDE